MHFREREHTHTHTIYFTERERAHTHTPYILHIEHARTHTHILQERRQCTKHSYAHIHTAVINRRYSMQSACASPPQALRVFCLWRIERYVTLFNHFNHCCVSCAAAQKQSIYKMSVHGLASCATIDDSHKAKNVHQHTHTIYFTERERAHTHTHHI